MVVIGLPVMAPSWAHRAISAGTSGDCMKPTRASTRNMPWPIGRISSVLPVDTHGTGSVTTENSTTSACRTRLCLTWWSTTLGTLSVPEVMNTAVPSTRGSGFCSRSARNRSVGIAPESMTLPSSMRPR